MNKKERKKRVGTLKNVNTCVIFIFDHKNSCLTRIIFLFRGFFL